MRFSCKVFIPKNTPIPNDYRRYLLSLIKEAIKNSGSDGEDFYNRFYSGKNTKPFTFSAYFPLKKEGEENKLDGDYFSFFFSTNDYEFLMRVYNGLVEIKKRNDFDLFGTQITDIKNFFLFPEKNFTKNETIFKTLSPFLVRSLEDGDKYIYPEGFKIQTKDPEKDVSHWPYWEKSQNFIQAFETSLTALVQKELPDYKGKIKVEKIDCVVVPVLHGSGNEEHEYKMTFPGLKGQIKIKAEPEVLKLFYDIGIGARRSEGFGMLEVVG